MCGPGEVAQIDKSLLREKMYYVDTIGRSSEEYGRSHGRPMPVVTVNGCWRRKPMATVGRG